MPGLNRRDVVNPEVDGIYLVTSRCVRQLFLMRNKRGKKAIRRRRFVLKRIRELAADFGISVGFHAILENHLHLLLANLPSVVRTWSDAEVLRRVCRIFPYKFKRMGVQNRCPTAGQIASFSADEELMKEMRLRLGDPSWFMRQLMQSVAVKFNAEDKVKGHFVDRRFHCKPITDETGLLLGGLYIDLNELRAKLAPTPEASTFSSVGVRIAARQLREAGQPQAAARHDGYLRPLSTLDNHPDADPVSGTQRVTDEGMLDMTLEQYLSVLESAGRVPREGKRGTITANLPPILDRIRTDDLREALDNFDDIFRSCVGGSESMASNAATHNRHGDDIDTVQGLEDQSPPQKRQRDQGARRRHRKK